MCVYYESLCRDRCLQWGWVICLHYTTVAQPPRTIIYSDLPKHTHTHPETGSMLEAKTLYTRPCLEHIMVFSELFWCIPTPQTKASSFTHAFFFRLHLCQHAHKDSCSSLGASKLTLIQLRCGRCSEVEPESDPGSVWQPLTVLRCCDKAQRASLLSVFANRVLLRSR